MDLKIVVICWPGVEKNAHHISSALNQSGENVTVIYSTKDNSELSGDGNWIQVPDEYYYGRKFLISISDSSFDVMLHIHADSQFDDWPMLVRRCRACHESTSALSVWSPTPDNSAWLNKYVQITKTRTPSLLAVAQTDCIVWSFTREVADRLLKFDYVHNNLGWGIDWAAVIFSYASGRFAVRDTSISIRHKPGTNYQGGEAERQMTDFLTELTESEKVVFELLKNQVRSNLLKWNNPTV